MAGAMLATTQVRCAHGGVAVPAAGSDRVRIGGQPVIVVSNDWIVTGCALAASGSPTGACRRVQWLQGSQRVRATGVPLLLQASPGLCHPAGSAPLVTASAGRVTVA